MADKTHAIVIIINTQGQIVAENLGLLGKIPNVNRSLQNSKVSKCKVETLALKWYPHGFHWPSDV